MKKIIFLLMLLILSNVSAICEDGQIDINAASQEDLIELAGIGKVKSQSIIEARPFDCVDELIDIYGIGEKTLGKIKTQGLACVENENCKVKEVEEEKVVEEKPMEIEGPDVVKEVEEPLETGMITLFVPKDIKSEDEKESLDKDKLAKYGFVIFCVLLGSLFMLRKNGRE